MAVTSTTIEDGSDDAIIQITGESAETATAIVDVSELTGAPSAVRIIEMWYATQGLALNLLWDADADVLGWTVPENASGYLDFRKFNGLKSNAGAGATGDIKLTTVGHASGDGFSLVVRVAK